MSYATIEDIKLRSRRDLSEAELSLCNILLEDSAVIIDTYNVSADVNAKKIVSCNMVIRALGDGNASQFPIGATQGTVSALGYSQTFTMGSGSTGELYLSKMDKNILGIGRKLGFINPLEKEND